MIDRYDLPVRRGVLGIFSALLLIFLVAPTLVVIPISFSSGTIMTFPLPGLSLQWYDDVINSPAWRSAVSTVAARPQDRVIAAEKLDGTNGAVLRLGREIIAINRAGWPARTSPYAMHHRFADWVEARRQLFLDLLIDRERLAGEWMAQAHGTRYSITNADDLFVVFDLIVDVKGKDRRATHDELVKRTVGSPVRRATVLSDGPALGIEAAMDLLGPFGFDGAIDGPEGVVWRVESKGRFNFMAKYVKPAKRNGCYLPELTGGQPVWNFELPEAA